MPIYEYQCPKCGETFEEWGKASESHKEEPCPKCGTPSPRIISRTSFVLKGDGWYVSDYGYRKGISEDSGGKADVPLPSTPTTPAKQADKSLVAKEHRPPAKKEDSAKKSPPKGGAKKGAPKTESKSAAKTEATSAPKNPSA